MQRKIEFHAYLDSRRIPRLFAEFFLAFAPQNPHLIFDMRRIRYRFELSPGCGPPSGNAESGAGRTGHARIPCRTGTHPCQRTACRFPARTFRREEHASVGIFRRVVNECRTRRVIRRVMRHDLCIPDKRELHDGEYQERQDRQHKHTLRQYCTGTVTVSSEHVLAEYRQCKYSRHLAANSSNASVIHVPKAIATPNGTLHFSFDFGGNAAFAFLRS